MTLFHVKHAIAALLKAATARTVDAVIAKGDGRAPSSTRV
jgi:hypothetical protein